MPGGAAKVGPKLRDTDLVGRRHPHRVAVLSQTCRGPENSRGHGSLMGARERVGTPGASRDQEFVGRQEQSQTEQLRGVILSILGLVGGVKRLRPPPRARRRPAFTRWTRAPDAHPGPWKVLMKAPLALASTLNWFPTCWPVLTSTTETGNCWQRTGSPVPGRAWCYPRSSTRSPLTVPHNRACRRRRLALGWSIPPR